MRASAMLMAVGLMAGVFPAVTAAQVNIPIQADAGRVLQQHQQDWYMRQNTPWMYRPVTEADMKDPRTRSSVIEFHEMQVEAEILGSGEPPVQ